MRKLLTWLGAAFFLSSCQSPGFCPLDMTGVSSLDQSQYHDPFKFGSKIQVSQRQSMSTQASDPLSDSKVVIVLDHSCTPEPGSLSEKLVDRKLASQKGSSLRSHQFEVDDFETEIDERVESDRCVVGVSQSGVLGLVGEFSAKVADPSLAESSHLKTVKAIDSQKMFFDPVTGIKSEVVIAIIDSGVDVSHEDLKDNIWVNADEIPNNQKDDDSNGYVDDYNGYNFASRSSDPNAEGDWDGNYHGTHVAGLAAARSENGRGSSGVMGAKVKIMALNVFGKSSGASIPNIDNAIRYAADNGAQVINMSLGGPGKYASTESAIVYALRKGATIVVAAGNENSNLDGTHFLSPASYGSKFKGMITVGSSDVIGDLRSRFSNYGPAHVEIGAPGSVDSSRAFGLFSTVLNDQYARAQGTSMASPVAAGAAALAVGLIKSKGGSPTPSAIEELLFTSGRSVRGLSTYFKGGKIVDTLELGKLIQSKFSSGSNPFPPGEPLPRDDQRVDPVRNLSSCS